MSVAALAAHPPGAGGLDDAMPPSLRARSPGRPPRRARRWALVALAVVLVLGAAGGALHALAGPGSKSQAAPYPTTWAPRILPIVRFVEKTRGLRFEHPVKVAFLSDAAFDKEVAAPGPTSASDKAAMTQRMLELRAVGLIHGNVDLGRAETTLNQGDIVGLYVNDKKTVFVRGASLTPYVRTTLAHELTHALQDQHFDLTRLQQDATGDSSALDALVEGDAVRTQNAYQAALSDADQQLYQEEQGQLQAQQSSAPAVPAVLGDIQGFPYAFGPTFVDALVARGGTGAIDQAFRDPPVAEAQIVDPAAYPLTWKPEPVPVPVLPTGDHRVDDPSPFGQVSLFEVLGSRLGFDQAWAAVQGWKGDNSVPYRDNGRTCMAIDVRMASTARAQALAATTATWAQGIPGATAAQSGRDVRIRSCDPGAAAPAPPDLVPVAFDVLAARAGIIDEIMTGNSVDFTVGRCITNQVFTSLGPANYSELTASTLTDAQRSQLQGLVESAAGSCVAGH